DSGRPRRLGHEGPVPGEVGQVRRLRDERGASLVEFALVAPVLFLVIMGAIALVWLTAVRSTITGAARDGARFASIPDCSTAPCAYPPATDVQQYVADRASGYGVDPKEVTVSATPTYRNETVKVTVTHEIPALFGFIHVTYTSTAEARSE